MNTAPSRDQVYTHRTLNHVNACFQGRFAELNVLAQLQHPSFNPEQIKETKSVILTIKNWLNNMYQGAFILSEQAPERSSEGQQVLEVVEQLKVELDKEASRVKALIVSEEMSTLHEDAILLVGSLARCSYSRDNYLRGHIKFNQWCNNAELVERYSTALETIKNELKLVTEFVTAAQELERLDRAFGQHIKFFARTLPGVFRAQAHDMRQILSGSLREFSFEAAEFLKPEIDSWKNQKFEPVEAGYWRAHEISPEEANLWIALEVGDPLVAAEWNSAGFEPEVASLWLDVQFSPFLAIQWHNAGFCPDVALQLVQQGYQHPEDVPADVLNKVLAEFELIDPRSEESVTVEQTDEKETEQKEASELQEADKQSEDEDTVE
jgi:hypothetical protein